MSKYGNKKTEYKGVMYDSRREADYAKQLDTQRMARDASLRVVSWEGQIPFQVELNGKKICKYIADFRVLYDDGHIEIIDVKGMKTPVYRLKKKLVEAQYGIEILER